MIRKGEMRMRKGFTIIETTLVIAIAGLIFLMVFVALPGLRAQQRDTDRREDVTKVIREIKDYQTNNRGALPTDWGEFHINYLDSDSFMDPDGTEYTLSVVQCGAETPDSECTDDELGQLASASFPNGYTVYVVLQASCSGEKAVGSSNPRKVAVLYRLERAGIYCENS